MDASSAWARRPSTAVSRLRGRRLLLLSARDLLKAAASEKLQLVALVAPAPAAISGFARAARDAGAPLLLVRPSGAAEEKGPEEARDDAAFVEAAMRAAAELGFTGPMALLKEPPRAGSAVPDSERVQREIEAGFTGVALASSDEAAAARDAALAAAVVCRLELGLEVVPLGGSARAAVELAIQLRSRGALPSALRLTGLEDEARALLRELDGVAISSATETELGGGVQQLVASGPFLRALVRAAPAEVLERLQEWADEKGATLEQAAARHQRLLRDLPAETQDKLEALCCFEAGELYARAGSLRTGARLAGRVGELHQREL